MIRIERPNDTFAIPVVHDLKVGAWDEHAAALRTALAANGVVCVRIEQALEDEELQALAGLFGPIKDPVGATKDGGQFRYGEPRQIIDSGFVMTDEIREKLGELSFGGLDDERPGLFETYHCDDTYTECPARATVLHACALPPSGGGPTCFIDMRAAYQMLDEAARNQVDALRVVYAYNNEDAFPPRRAARGPAEVLLDVSHPLVRTHPEAGSRALFMDLDRAHHVEEMLIDEGRALLRGLQDRAEAGAPECKHHWQDHDVLVWDNASVQHKAGGNFAVGEPRRFWRYMIEGERPV
ncbi:MAG TPA: TauD/TfdA family dioxygenase [Myxococcales bacterium]|nr:TauD/TfdA family dioxygenase [Myxococcales bacterium]